MFNNKRGLSTIITTLIIILLVLVAIGIIWVVVKSVIDQGATQINTAALCPAINLEIKNVGTCDADGCSITIERGATGEAFDGIYSIVTDGSNSNDDETDGNILPLETKTISVDGIANPTKVSITPYFRIEGKVQYCNTPSEYII